MSLDPLAEKLRSLSPAPAGLDRDRLLFEAGRRAALPATGWKLTTLAACLLSAGTMSLHYLSPVERVVYITAPQAASVELAAVPSVEPIPESRPESAWSLYELRQQAMQATAFVPAVLPADGKAPQPLTVGSSLMLYPTP